MTDHHIERGNPYLLLIACLEANKQSVPPRSVGERTGKEVRIYRTRQLCVV